MNLNYIMVIIAVVLFALLSYYQHCLSTYIYRTCFHGLDAAKKYWAQERVSGFLHVGVIALAFICSLLCYFKLLDPRAAVVMMFPLALSIYRVFFRFNFRSLSAMLFAVSATLLYVNSLMISDRGFNVLNLGIDGHLMAENIRSFSIYASSGLVGIGVLGWLEEIGKALLSKFLNSNSDDGSSKYQRFQQARKAILNNRSRGFSIIVFIIFALSLLEVAWAIVDFQPIVDTSTQGDIDNQTAVIDQIDNGNVSLANDALSIDSSLQTTDASQADVASTIQPNTNLQATPDANVQTNTQGPNNNSDSEVQENNTDGSDVIPLMAQFGMLSFALCFAGTILFSYIPDRSDVFLMRAELANVGYRTSLLANKRARKKEITDQTGVSRKIQHEQDDIFQVFFHIMYSPKLFLSSHDSEECASKMLQNELQYHAQNRAGNVCLTTEALNYLITHRTFTKKYFAESEESDAWGDKKEEYAKVSGMLMNNVKAIFLVESTGSQELAPLTLFTVLCQSLDKSVNWSEKQRNIFNASFPIKVAFQLAISNMAYHYVNRDGIVTNSDGCSVNGLCLSNTCPLQITSRNHVICALWCDLLTFPTNVSKQMSKFVGDESEKIFQELEYLLFFKALVTSDSLRFLEDSAIVVDGFRKLSEVLLPLKDTPFLDNISFVWNNLDFDQSRKAKALCAYKEREKRIEAVLIATNWVAPDNLSGNLDSLFVLDKAKKCWMLLYYLTL